MKEINDPSRLKVKERKIQLDEQKVTTTTQESLVYLMEKKPEYIPSISYAAGHKAPEDPLSNRIIEIFNHIEQLAEIPTLRTIPQEWLNENLWQNTMAESITDLDEIGIHLQPDDFNNLPKYKEDQRDFSLYDLVINIQRESAGIRYATKAYEAARQLLSSNTPTLPLPNNHVYCVFKDSSQANAYMSSDRDGNHLLIIQGRAQDFTHYKEQDLLPYEEEYHDDDNYDHEYLDPRIMQVIHEIGHAVFYEKLKPEYLIAKPGEPEYFLFGSMTEGLAIMYERLGEELFASFTNQEGHELNVNTAKGRYAFRDKYLHTEKNWKGKDWYLVGHKMMRYLVLQLELQKQDRCEQIVGVLRYLENIDISKINQENITIPEMEDDPKAVWKKIPPKFGGI
ncbi:MAG TPA: hypothetical protein PKI92_00720 [Candidatus Woesebacteria bacterium]|nr:hypothetical protein [Candidatus Woesebacteria bacterium]HPR99286.1 hypothetical protein [Candidatus Woesebacteria bacterium]